MTDRSRAPVSIDATHVGRTNLGPSTVTLDDESLTVVVGGGESPTHVALSSIDELMVSDSRLELRLRDGTRITLVSQAAAELRDDVAARCRALPELTRTLRAFGSRRGQRPPRARSASEQQRFFSPLMDARRAALSATAPVSTIDAFDAQRLAAAIVDALQALAAERFAEPGPERRALEAELLDLSEPLTDALVLLGEAAASAAGHIDDLREWRAWAAQLRATFEVADRVWMTLDASLDREPGGV